MTIGAVNFFGRVNWIAGAGRLKAGAVIEGGASTAVAGPPATAAGPVFQTAAPAALVGQSCMECGPRQLFLWQMWAKSQSAFVHP